MGQSGTGKLALLILCLGSMLVSCSVSKQTNSTPSRQDSPSDSPGILFLNYEISRDDQNSSYSARLINQFVAEGRLKSSKSLPLKPVPGDLEVQVLDKNQRIVETIHIPNPLDKTVEFVKDTGELEQKMISLDSAEFSVRLQLEPGAHVTLLKRITGADSENTILLKTPIQ
jgi:hypothetical protein